MTQTQSRRLRSLQDRGFNQAYVDDGYTDPATIAAASRLGLAAALLSGVGLVLLALI